MIFNPIALKTRANCISFATPKSNRFTICNFTVFIWMVSIDSNQSIREREHYNTLGKEEQKLGHSRCKGRSKRAEKAVKTFPHRFQTDKMLDFILVSVFFAILHMKIFFQLFFFVPQSKQWPTGKFVCKMRKFHWKFISCYIFFSWKTEMGWLSFAQFGLSSSGILGITFFGESNFPFLFLRNFPFIL